MAAKKAPKIKQSSAVTPKVLKDDFMDPADICLLPESGWRELDKEHHDHLMKEAMGGQLFKNVLAKPKVHSNHKGSDGRSLLLDGKHITGVIMEMKGIYEKLQAGDEEAVKNYGEIEWTDDTVTLLIIHWPCAAHWPCSRTFALRQSLLLRRSLPFRHSLALSRSLALALSRSLALQRSLPFRHSLALSRSLAVRRSSALCRPSGRLPHQDACYPCRIPKFA